MAVSLQAPGATSGAGGARMTQRGGNVLRDHRALAALDVERRAGL
jgi:hypothetical protein